jgi:hypothetical protein
MVLVIEAAAEEDEDQVLVGGEASARGGRRRGIMAIAPSTTSIGLGKWQQVSQ